MEQYEALELKIVKIKTEDVICGSNTVCNLLLEPVTEGPIVIGEG